MTYFHSVTLLELLGTEVRFLVALRDLLLRRLNRRVWLCISLRWEGDPPDLWSHFLAFCKPKVLSVQQKTELRNCVILIYTQCLAQIDETVVQSSSSVRFLLDVQDPWLHSLDYFNHSRKNSPNSHVYARVSSRDTEMGVTTAFPSLTTDYLQPCFINRRGDAAKLSANH